MILLQGGAAAVSGKRHRNAAVEQHRCLCRQSNGAVPPIRWRSAANPMAQCRQSDGAVRSIRWRSAANPMAQCCQSNGAVLPMQCHCELMLHALFFPKRHRCSNQSERQSYLLRRDFGFLCLGQERTWKSGRFELCCH